MIKIDEDICIGCGACAASCPDYFDINDDGKAYLLKEVAEVRECIQDAIDACPVAAIKDEKE